MNWIYSLAMFAAGVIFSAGILVAGFRITRRDVNGLGKNLRKTWACELRCAAEEDPIKKAKLLHIADLMDPK